MRWRVRVSMVVAGLAAVLFLALHFMGDYVIPVILALFFAAVIDPFVDGLEVRGFPRGAGTLVVMATIGSGVALIIWAIVTNLLRELHLFIDNVPYYSHVLGLWAARWQQAADSLFVNWPISIKDWIADGMRVLAEGSGMFAAHWVGIMSRVPHIVSIFTVTAMATYFLSRDKRRMGSFIMGFIPARWHAELLRVKNEISAGLIGFAKAQIILLTLSASLSTVGFAALGHPYAWGLGALAGAMDLVPMVGPSAIFVPVLVAHIATGNWLLTIGTAAVWLAVMVSRQLIEPILVGRHVGIHPLTTIFAVYWGSKWMGVNGLILGPVVAVAAKAIMAVSILPHLRRD